MRAHRLIVAVGAVVVLILASCGSDAGSSPASPAADGGATPGTPGTPGSTPGGGTPDGGGPGSEGGGAGDIGGVLSFRLNTSERTVGDFFFDSPRLESCTFADYGACKLMTCAAVAPGASGPKKRSAGTIVVTFSKGGATVGTETLIPNPTTGEYEATASPGGSPGDSPFGEDTDVTLEASGAEVPAFKLTLSGVPTMNDAPVEPPVVAHQGWTTTWTAAPATQMFIGLHAGPPDTPDNQVGDLDCFYDSAAQTATIPKEAIDALLAFVGANPNVQVSRGAAHAQPIPSSKALAFIAVEIP